MKRRSIFYWMAGILIAAIAIAAAFYFDDAVRNFISQHQNRTVRNFMHNVSRFGDWLELVTIGVVGLALAFAFANRRWQRIFVAMLVACALAGVAARGIKIVSGRARPSVQSEKVWSIGNLSSKYHAFPSGHVAASAGFFGALFLARRRWAAVFLFVPIIIGASRVYVGAHYLSDVVFAWFLGVACALLVVRWLAPAIDDLKSEIRN